MDKYKLKKKDFERIIDIVYKDEILAKYGNKDTFKQVYFDKVVKRLKDGPVYKFNKEQYQTSIRLYFYYSQEKDIYNILALAKIEEVLFNDWVYKRFKPNSA